MKKDMVVVQSWFQVVDVGTRILDTCELDWGLLGPR